MIWTASTRVSRVVRSLRCMLFNITSGEAVIKRYYDGWDRSGKERFERARCRYARQGGTAQDVKP